MIVLVVSTLNCGGAVAPEDAGVDEEAAADGNKISPQDAAGLPDGFDAQSCYGDELLFGDGICDSERDAICAAWARDRAYGGIGYSKCVIVGGLAECSLGTYCPTDNSCRCSEDLTCPLGDVCYSESSSIPLGCKLPCTP